MIGWVEYIEFAQIILSLGFLIISSIYDLRTREIPNIIWVLFAPIGVALMLLRFLLIPNSSFLLSWGISLAIITILSLAFFYLGFFGGADAKALICLGLAIPLYPSSVIPILQVIAPFFPLSVFGNAVLCSAFMVLVISGYNLSQILRGGDRLFEGLEKEPLWKKIAAFATAVKIDLNQLKRHSSHYIPLEQFSLDETGKTVRHLKIAARLEDEESDNQKDLAEIPYEISKIWATPGLPFLVFITIGFAITLLIGDILTWCVLIAIK